MHVVASLGNALHVGSTSCLYEFTELNFLSVGSQLPPRTLNILTDRLIGESTAPTVQRHVASLHLKRGPDGNDAFKMREQNFVTCN